MASFDRSIAPRSDSSASMLWGGTRPPEGRGCSGRMSLIDCTSRPPPPEGGHRRVGALWGGRGITLWICREVIPTPEPTRRRALGSNVCSIMLPRRTRVKALRPTVQLLGDDLDRQRHLDLAVEADRHLVRAQRLDGLDRHLAPVELDACLGLDRLGDVGRGDRAEEPPALAGPRLDFDALGRQLAGGGLRPLLLPPVTDLAGTAHRLRLALDARGGHHGQALRHEVVPGVAGGHFDQVALVAEGVDVGPQHDLHVWTPWWEGTEKTAACRTSVSIFSVSS